MFSANSPARAIVRNSKQYNGKHGCDWCEFPGETIDNSGAPTRYYPYRGPPVMCTAENQIRYGLEAVGSCGDVKGVKGPSVIGVLPSFDQVRGVAVDFMHCVCLGVNRQFVGLWVDSKNHDHELLHWYKGR